MCGPHFCSMKLTQDVRDMDASGELDAIVQGMQSKAAEFREAGSELYHEPGAAE
jgi:phosphomethylpyrimidine synthase